jgi:hypothetical protein
MDGDSKGPAPVGRRIVVNAGEISFAGASAMRGDSKRRKRLQMRQLKVEEFERLVVGAETRGDDAVVVPLPLAKVVASCAAAGVRRDQGRSGKFKSQADEDACEAALREAAQLVRQYLDEARAMGRRNPRRWAREETAKAVQQKMRELGVANPPAVATIMKRKF